MYLLPSISYFRFGSYTIRITLLPFVVKEIYLHRVNRHSKQIDQKTFDIYRPKSIILTDTFKMLESETALSLFETGNMRILGGVLSAVMIFGGSFLIVAFISLIDAIRTFN